MMQFEDAEDATLLSEEEKEGLNILQITTQAELNRWEQANIGEAAVWLSKARKPDVLSEDFLRKLHNKMLGKVWSWAGTFRRSEKNIGSKWISIHTDLRMLLEDVRFWIAHETFPPDEIAARFHHRLVLVHPFPNGNGRHARMAADALLTRVLKAKPFSWGSGNLTDAGETRERYIQALRSADRSDYGPLMAFVRS